MIKDVMLVNVASRAVNYEYASNSEWDEGLYLPNDSRQRYGSLLELEDILADSTLPMACVGDLNAMRSRRDKSGRPPNQQSCRDLNDFITACRLKEISDPTSTYTWSNRRDSWAWTKIEDKIAWTIENGQSALFWLDKWGDVLLKNCIQANDYDTVSKDFHLNVAMARNKYMQQSINIPLAMTHVSEITLTDKRDSLGWKSDPNMKLTSTMFYEALRHKANKEPWRKLIWNNTAPPRACWFVYMACDNRLPTLDCIQRRGITLNLTFSSGGKLCASQARSPLPSIPTTKDESDASSLLLKAEGNGLRHGVLYLNTVVTGGSKMIQFPSTSALWWGQALSSLAPEFKCPKPPFKFVVATWST
ncbi:hypothetical protein EJ110_NYTH40102 [Nymphaea thermarum]|nr:hypothetical protein EJ110_NYTH40102 [Nymphaea thermarum]